MDKSLFISSHGAKNAMRQLEVLTNNMANVNTNGFKADQTFMQQYDASSKDNNTRSYSKLEKIYTNFDPGSIINTGRDLDLAVDGDGFIAVQSKSGREGYARTGSLQMTPDGSLITSAGHLVMGNSGIINIPPSEKLHISPDGSISAVLLGTTDLVPIDKIKLTNPNVTQLQKGEDGLFYMNSGASADDDINVKIVSGALEGSNVNVIDTMAKLIDLSRGYEIHTNYMKTIADNTSKSNEILSI
jgi:flagellar basal-body rod protein FlgF